MAAVPSADMVALSGSAASYTVGPGVARVATAQAPNAASARARLKSAAAIRRHDAGLGPPNGAPVCAAPLAARPAVPASAESAAANSPAVPNRSAGSFSSAVSTALSTDGGTVRLTLLGAAGSAVITLATIDCAVGPVNGGSPTSIS